MFSLAASVRSSHPRRRRTLWRSLWVLVLLLHAPATIKVYSMALGGEPGWSSLLLISATNLFFIFEIIFAWSLHLFSDRRSAIAFVLIVALLHVGVVDHGFPEQAIKYDLPILLVFTASSIAVGLRLAGRLLACFQGLAALLIAQRRRLARLIYRRRVEVVPVLRRPDHCWLCAPLRAPPSYPI